MTGHGVAESDATERPSTRCRRARVDEAPAQAAGGPQGGRGHAQGAPLCGGWALQAGPEGAETGRGHGRRRAHRAAGRLAVSPGLQTFSPVPVAQGQPSQTLVAVLGLGGSAPRMRFTFNTQSSREKREKF